MFFRRYKSQYGDIEPILILSNDGSVLGNQIRNHMIESSILFAFFQSHECMYIICISLENMSLLHSNYLVLLKKILAILKSNFIFPFCFNKTILHETQHCNLFYNDRVCTRVE